MLTHTNKQKASDDVDWKPQHAFLDGATSSASCLRICHAKHETALAQYFNNYQRRGHTSFSTSARNVISSCDEILPQDGYVLFLLSASFVRRGDPECCRKPEC